MSEFEFQQHSVHNYPDGSFTGSDPLWLQDPGAKAVYSSNPGFTEGILKKDRSPVQEALRAMHLYAPERTQAVQTLQADAVPIVSGLALEGLNWLIPQISEPSPA